jgi:hypothetical protein
MSSQLRQPNFFPFLDLPAELRDRVYELVLATPKKTTVVPFDKDGKVHQRLFVTDLVTDPTGHERKELNQMKFVNKQLYEETSPLLPHSPRLIFPSRTDTKDAASLICGRFIGYTRSDALRAIRCVDIFERMPHRARGYSRRVFDIVGVSQLVAFAKALPLVTINVYLESVEPDRAGFNAKNVAELIETIARKTSNTPHSNMGVTVSQLHQLNLKTVNQMTGVWSGYALDAPVFPANIVFRPGFDLGRQAWVLYYESQWDLDAERAAWYRNDF